MNLISQLSSKQVITYELQLAVHWAICINAAKKHGANQIQIRALRCLSDFEFRMSKLRDKPAWTTRIDKDGDVILHFITIEATCTGVNIVHSVEVAIDIFGIMTTVDRISKRCEIFDPFQECARFGNDILNVGAQR